MLGLSLVCNLACPIDERLVAHVTNNSGSTLSGNSTRIVWRDSHVLLLASGYPGYPITVDETDDYSICVEGRVYQPQQSPWYQSLAAIAADILSGESHAVARAASCLAEIDGDFVAAFQHRRSRDVVIFNDALGRLPLYVNRTDSDLVVSRDLAFVGRVTGRVQFDRLAIAEYLVYGYPLGRRTLVDSTERLPPAGTIDVRRHAKHIGVVRLVVPSVASRSGMTRKKMEEAARKLSQEFKRACAVRVAGAKNSTLSLSGGLDSRAVAAGLSENNLPFLGVTLAASPHDKEALLAAKIASILQFEWRIFPVQRRTGANLLRLLRMKSGLNYLRMASLLPFLDSLQAEFGSGMILLTGDGGDKIFPDHRPAIPLRSEQALVRYVVEHHAIFPLSMVAALTGVSPVDVITALEARINSYPEDRLEDKYTHFLLFERAFKWAFEGEDRNRHFFWSVAPLYARTVFREAMSCPSGLKTDYALYRLFFESLNPELVDVESTTCGASLRFERRPLRQFRRAVRRWARDLTPLSFKQYWRNLTAQPVPSVLVSCIHEQFAASSPVGAFLSPPHATAVLEKLGPVQAYMLLTLTSAIEYLATGGTTIERYGDSVF